MRILFISNVYPNPCQPTKGLFNRRLVEALARHHEVRVICPVSWTDRLKAGLRRRTAEPAAGAGAVQAFFPRFYYPPKILRTSYGEFLWRSVRGTVERLLGQWTPDAIVGYWAHPDGYVALRAARMIGVPAVVMAGGTDVLLLTDHPGRRRRIVDVLTGADGVVVVGAHLRKRLLELGLPDQRISIVPRGVDENHFHPGDRSEARRRLGIPADRRMLLWVGRMVPVKGLDVLLAACTLLRQRGLPFHLYLIGGGELESSIAKKVAADGLGKAVSLVGPVPPERLGDWYRAADLTVLPSRSEGVPNVLRESLACGTPFVASNVGGVSELTPENHDCLVPPGDVEALAQAIARHLDRKGAPPATNRNGTWDASAQSLIRVLEPLVERCQNPDRPWWTGGTLGRGGNVGGGGQILLAAKKRIRQALATCRMPSADSVYLTFDDGPHPEHTLRLLDTLAEHEVSATFFVIGRLVERYPDIVRRIAAEGHAVGNHSFFHARPSSISANQLMSEVRRANRLLEEILGVPPRVFRPPFGEVGGWKLWRLWNARMQVVLWSVDPKDYQCGSAAELSLRLAATPVNAGDIVLMHDRLPYAAEALPHWIAQVRARGLLFKTIGAAVPTQPRQELPMAPTVA
jgi:peptidoglycan/xylan/chitin deacetylase (PgdA/CDA1 family)